MKKLVLIFAILAAPAVYAGEQENVTVNLGCAATLLLLGELTSDIVEVKLTANFLGLGE